MHDTVVNENTRLALELIGREGRDEKDVCGGREAGHLIKERTSKN